MDLNFARLYAVCLCVCVLKNTFSLIFPSDSYDRVIDDDDLSDDPRFVDGAVSRKTYL